MLSKGYPFIPIRTLQHKLKQGALINMKLEKSDTTEDKNKINSRHDPIELQSLKTNPWIVEEISDFLKYCCPECNHNDQNLELFQEHSLKNHTNSIMLFKMKSEQEDFKHK